MAELKRTSLSVRQEKAVLVGVILPDSTADPRDPLGELASLAKTAGATVVGRITQRRQAPHAGTYVGRGKAEEIARLAKRHRAEMVIFDNDLSPGQIGGLEKIINETAGSRRGEGIKVLDRSELILDIFATRARTHEARLQVELAQMEYTYPRLTRMWNHLERIAAGTAVGIGTRGPGETQLETDRRIVRKRINALKQDMAKVHERKSRLVAQRTTEHFTACLVGYTNAGKSTLFNTLVDAGTYADDKLFATLDTKTRLWEPDRGQPVLLSDTVGFVRDLPHDLVASFKATLEEAVHADVLLHVLDVAHPHAQQQYDSVRAVLSEIGVAGTLTDKPELLLLNKTDTPEGESAGAYWAALRPDAIPISARTGRGLGRLADAVLGMRRGEEREVDLTVDATDGKLLAYVEAHARVVDRTYETNGRSSVRLRAHVGRQTLGDLQAHPGVEISPVEGSCG